MKTHTPGVYRCTSTKCGYLFVHWGDGRWHGPIRPWSDTKLQSGRPLTADEVADDYGFCSDRLELIVAAQDPSDERIRAYLDRNPEVLRAAIRRIARIDPKWLRDFLGREQRRERLLNPRPYS